MDRPIVYIGAIPQDTDLLLSNKNAMIGSGWIAQATMGTSTLFYGLGCTPTAPATLTVNIAPGCVFSQQNIDNSAYGSLSSDTTHQIVKVGLNPGTLNFPCPAPVTSGHSVVYLIEAAFEETDTGSTVLPYYNASNPATPWAGPNNTGVSQNTVRQNICNIQLKAGVPATTGSQVTPAPDVGFTGLWAITVANNQTTITSGNIAEVSGAPFITESLTQKISQSTADARYAQISQVQTDALDFALDTSMTANTLVAALNPAISTLTQGMTVVITVANNSTGPSTLNLNGTGAKNITYKGNALVGGELVAGQNAAFSYNGATWNLMSVAANQSTFYTGGTTTGSANSQVLSSVTPSGFTLQFGDVVTFTAGFTNTGATQINVDGTGLITIKAKNGSGGLVDLTAGQLTATDSYQIIYDGVYWELYSLSFPPASTFFQVANNLSEGVAATMRTNLGLGSAALLASSAVLQTANALSELSSAKTTAQTNLGVRNVLMANAQYYINASTGNDSNPGTSGSPWLTLQNAVNYVQNNIDLAGFTVTFNATGNFTAGVQMFGKFVGQTNELAVVFSFSSGSTVTATNSSAFLIHDGAQCTIQGTGTSTVISTTGSGNNGNAVEVAYSSSAVTIGAGINFGSCYGNHLSNTQQGWINIQDNYTISGGAGSHFSGGPGSVISVAGSANTVTLTGTPAFTTFAVQQGPGEMDIGGLTFSGSATGTRYSVTRNGVINTNGGGASFLPGNIVGSFASGGQYL